LDGELYLRLEEEMYCQCLSKGELEAVIRLHIQPVVQEKYTFSKHLWVPGYCRFSFSAGFYAPDGGIAVCSTVVVCKMVQCRVSFVLDVKLRVNSGSHGWEHNSVDEEVEPICCSPCQSEVEPTRIERERRNNKLTGENKIDLKFRANSPVKPVRGADIRRIHNIPQADRKRLPIIEHDSCPDQRITFLITDDSDIDTESIHLLVNGVEYTTDSSELSFLDSLLEFHPSNPFTNGDTVRFSLVNLSDTEGASLGEPVSGYFVVDTEPPTAGVISPSPWDVLRTRQPEIVFTLWDNISGVNYDSITLVINDSIVSVPDSALTFTGETLVISTVRAGIVLDDGETLSICLRDVMDSPDICSPNRLDGAVCTEFEVNLVFTCELVVSSFPLNPRRLYFGLARGATDGFDFLVDRIMLPPVGAAVDAKFYIEDERYPALHHLANDYRGTDSDTTVWRIETSGEGEATVSWNPEMLGEGVFLLNNWLDMKSYNSFQFTLGETLTIHFFFKPQIEFPIQLADGWNLISLPVYPSSYRTDELFPSLAFAYDNQSGRFFAPGQHITGLGYFVHSSLPETTLIVGIPIEKIRTKLFPGWNLISATSETASLPGGLVIPPAYRFSTSPPLYLPETELYPGNGYWVLSRGEGMLDIPAEVTRYLLPIPDDPSYLKMFGALPPFITREDTTYTDKVLIYPNPFNSTVHFSASNGEIERIEIFNINGEIVFHTEVNGKTVSWEPKSLPSGLYLVRLKTSGRTARRRVLFLR